MENKGKYDTAGDDAETPSEGLHDFLGEGEDYRPKKRSP